MEPMKQLETKSFMTTPGPLAFPDALSILTWNINRGLQLDEVIEFLAGVVGRPDSCCRRPIGTPGELMVAISRSRSHKRLQ